jgi:predicted phosphodiesterase
MQETTLPEKRRAWRAHPALQRVAAAVTTLLAALAAVWLAMCLAGTTVGVGPVVVRWQVAPSSAGVTELRLPPIGTVSAVTHRTPITVSLLAERFQVRSTTALLAALEKQDTLQRSMERDARRAVPQAAARLLLFGLLAGLAFGRLIAPRNGRRIAATALLTVALLGLLSVGTLATYDRRGFRRLRFTGILSEAPKAIELVRRGLADVDRLRLQIRYATTNLARFYRVVESQPIAALPGEQIRVLHVSDLHDNAAGLDFARTLAKQYHIDEVVCTGDLTDYGTTAEDEFVAHWGALGPGSLFVMGNHDSRDTLAAVRRLPRATALADGVVTEAAGLRFVGWADPASLRSGLGSVDDSEPQLAGLEGRIRAALPRLQPPPDVLMVHNYHVAEALAGTVPVILYGHDHRLRIAEKAGSVLVDAGTTGAAGVRYFTTPTPPPYTAVLLTFRRGPRPRFLSADLFTLREPDDSFTVERFRPGSEATR